ncbi:LPS export ABC transporter permease LptG [Paludibacterium denitrificans]|uniref:LPS export ABC transporter permease LptG n=1 Tax=Paludibacterium denitrificans TaxID=2675226 RepID=UPI001E48C40B|nr:LPS export ABC transporter permease LptG [Paludibacterium denitrificans]
MLRFGLGFAVLTVVLGEFAAPYAEQQAERLKLSATRSMVAREFRSGIWVKDNRNFINVREMLPDTTLLGVRIYTYDENFRLMQTRFAERGSFSKANHARELVNIKETNLMTDHTTSRQLAKVEWKSIIEPEILNVLLVVPEQMSALNLVRYIEHLHNNKQQTQRYEIALWSKLFYPLACVSMALVALAFTPQQRRHGQLGVKLFAGICLGVGFHFINRLFGHLGLLYDWNAIVAATLPTLLFLLAGIALILRRKDADMHDLTPEQIAQYRQNLCDSRTRLAEFYTQRRDPVVFLEGYSEAVDQLIQRLWAELELGQQASLIAVGGYGRGQLFPHSDIDLLILLPTPTPDDLPARITRFISLMWDVGLEVGHSVRTLAECLSEARQDITIETNLLENRLIAGETQAYQQLITLLEQQRDPVAFYEGKTLEQQQRHNRHFGVTNNLEPNIKESPGGLRDLHTILWISKGSGLGDNWEALAHRGILTLAEARLIRQSERQLQRLRIDLHLLARRREDRLIFDLQATSSTGGQSAGHPGQTRQRTSDAALLPRGQDRQSA